MRNAGPAMRGPAQVAQRLRHPRGAGRVNGVSGRHEDGFQRITPDAIAMPTLVDSRTPAMLANLRKLTRGPAPAVRGSAPPRVARPLTPSLGGVGPVQFHPRGQAQLQTAQRAGWSRSPERRDRRPAEAAPVLDWRSGPSPERGKRPPPCAWCQPTLAYPHRPQPTINNRSREKANGALNHWTKPRYS